MKLGEITKKVNMDKKGALWTEPWDTPPLRDQREEKEPTIEIKEKDEEGAIHWKPSIKE